MHVIDQHGHPSSKLRPFETADIGEAQSHMARVFRSHHLHAHRGAKLAVRHSRLDAGAISAHWLRYGSRVSMTAPEMGDFYLFQFTLSGRCEVMHGSDGVHVESRMSYAVDPCRPLSKTWTDDCEQLILKVDCDRLDRFAMHETAVEAAGRLTFEFRPVGFTHTVDALVAMLRGLRDESPGQGLMHWRVRPHFDRTVMSLLLASYPHNLGAEFDRAARPCAPFYVRRAEEYIRAQAREPVTMEDLIAASGVSARSLFNGFRTYRATTPMAYLKAMRLDLARRELCDADPAQTTVTEVAMSCGFTHMGKFARDFRIKFGKSPSQILGRRADE
jgi:AraC-like DNA-binding protein